MLGALADRQGGPVTRARSSIRCCRRRGALASRSPTRAGCVARSRTSSRVLGGTRPAGDARRRDRVLRATRARFDARQARRGRHRLRVVPRRQRRARRRHNASKPSFAPRARFLRVTAPVGDGGDARAPAINRVCARCHQVLFIALPVHLGGARAQRRAAGRQQHQLAARRATSCSAAARARWRAPTATIRTRPSGRDARRAGGARRDGVCMRCHAKYADGGGAARAHAPRSGRRRRALPRVPHAAEEHGARLPAHALPPHRLADETAQGRGRSAARVRALPRRQDGRDAGGDDGARGGASVRPGAAARRCTGRPGARQSDRGDARARQAARAGGGAGARSARAATSARRRWWPRS